MRKSLRSIPSSGNTIGTLLSISQEPSGVSGAVYPSQIRHHRLKAMSPPLESIWCGRISFEGSCCDDVVFAQ